jgi:endoglucanase
LGPQQDLDCRLYNNTSASTSKNLSGGWFDAGDYNKYVNFAWSPVIDLLLAYEENPAIWTDDFNIPESGNGIPDLLDEVKYELDWLLKMQTSNGSVLSLVGVSNSATASPPSADQAPRRYGPATTSASYSASAMFALGAIQFQASGNTAYANTLKTAAINAWNWALANPAITFYNASNNLAAGEQEISVEQTSRRKTIASGFLFAATNDNQFKNYFDQNYTTIHLIEWGYAYPFEHTEQDGMLYYSKLTTASSTVSNVIKTTFLNSMSTNNTDNLPSYTSNADAYRAFLKNENYTWGSNTTKGRQGNMFMSIIENNLAPIQNSNYENAASGFIHYIHGVNPLNLTLMTNMGALGAENSIKSIYHGWFADGSPLWDEVGTSTYGPAPGYLPGGMNPGYDYDGCCLNNSCGSTEANNRCTSVNLSPPKNQPIQKSYKDFNDSWPLNSWTISEPSIYTQSAYIRLVSKFTSTVNCAASNAELKTDANIIENIYPNPVENKFTVITGDHNSIVQYSIIDLSGKVISSGSKKTQGNRIEIDENTCAGIYFFKIGQQDKIEIRKIVIR